MKKWPIIRHLRALRSAIVGTYRQVFIWRVSFEEALEMPMFRVEIDKTKRIWDGQE